MDRGSKVVCIGGGTGISTMLRGIKRYTDDLTAVVAVSDNGGHSGWLREEMNMLPPGDIRNCLIALADMEPLMSDLMQYRFADGALKGHNLGNLFIAALTEIYDSFGIAVEKANEVLAVKGQVLPVTTENIHVCARHYDGKVTEGEIQVVEESKLSHNPIAEVYLEPSNPQGYDKALKAIEEADKVVLGPGSLYTSIIPNLMVGGVKEAIKASKGKVFYVSNIMTQPGETDSYTLSMHIAEIEKYIGSGAIDYVIVNDEHIDTETLKLYEEEGAEIVDVDYDQLDDYEIIVDNLVEISECHGYIRHDAPLLGKIIMGRS